MLNNLLLVSSSPATRFHLDEILKQEDLIVSADNAEHALNMLDQHRFDVVILHAEQSCESAVSECRSIRSASPQSALIVTVKNPSLDFEVQILDAGADDILPIPCSVSQFRIHLNSAIRSIGDEQRGILRLGGLEMDPSSGVLTRCGEEIHLFPMEFKLLQFFMMHPNQSFTNDALCQRVWNGQCASAATVRTHIKTLRKKIDLPNQPSAIVTHYRRGYSLDVVV